MSTDVHCSKLCQVMKKAGFHPQYIPIDPLIRTSSGCTVLNCTKSFCILPSPYCIVVMGSIHVSSLCIPVNSLLSHWFVLVQSTHSYCIIVHCVYTVSILIGLYVIVAHLISLYRISPGKKHRLVQICIELIGMHYDQKRTNKN